MTPIAVHPSSVEWQAVLAYIQRRRLELIEQAIDLNLPIDERNAAAARIAELDELRSAPGTTREVSEAEAAGRESNRSVY